MFKHMLWITLMNKCVLESWEMECRVMRLRRKQSGGIHTLWGKVGLETHQQWAQADRYEAAMQWSCCSWALSLNVCGLSCQQRPCRCRWSSLHSEAVSWSWPHFSPTITLWRAISAPHLYSTVELILMVWVGDEEGWVEGQVSWPWEHEDGRTDSIPGLLWVAWEMPHLNAYGRWKSWPWGHESRKAEKWALYLAWAAQWSWPWWQGMG